MKEKTERGNKETSYLTFPGHFSLNPTICFLPKARALNFPLSYFFTNADSSILPSRQDDILDIMVSVNYILKVFNDMIDPSKTDIKDQSVYDYVRVVLKGISDSLGDIEDYITPGFSADLTFPVCFVDLVSINIIEHSFIDETIWFTPFGTTNRSPVFIILLVLFSISISNSPSII